MMYEDYEHDTKADREQYFRDLEWQVEESREKRRNEMRRRDYNLTRDIESYFS